MGVKSVTVKNLLVQRIDTTLNLVFIKGHIAGPKEGLVRIIDAEKGVKRVGRANAIKGIEPALPGINSLPFPYGGDELAAQLPVVVDAAPRVAKVRSSSPPLFLFSVASCVPFTEADVCPCFLVPFSLLCPSLVQPSQLAL
jgi:hypothetical protein